VAFNPGRETSRLRDHRRMEFRCFQPIEEIRQRPSPNGTARTSEEEHLALHHRTKLLSRPGHPYRTAMGA
jgi:hypothetical protein